jgi:hypothetical protein
MYGFSFYFNAFVASHKPLVIRITNSCDLPGIFSITNSPKSYQSLEKLALGMPATCTRDICWDTDGVNGGPSSITILLQWLATNNNYIRWCSTDLKRPLCEEILLEMNRHGIHHRSFHS